MNVTPYDQRGDGDKLRYCKLEARWINRELADLAILRRVDSLTGREIVGRKSGNYAGIAIPYVHPIAKHIVRRSASNLSHSCD